MYRFSSVLLLFFNVLYFFYMLYVIAFFFVVFLFFFFFVLRYTLMFSMLNVTVSFKIELNIGGGVTESLA